MQWLTNIRCFFADVCTWGAEEGSPFAQHAPAAVPLERHDLRNIGFEKVRRRALAQTAEKVIDLEREIPKMRALAIRRWDDAEQASKAAPPTRATRIGETEAFWDWAVLELLLQSGLRIEEASELTTLDVLRRRHPDGRTYYLLHVKPSKFARARVIPIGDGLGRVIAEIIRHVKAFYGTDRVPDCDHYDASEKRALPRAPYLLQGCRHPSPLAFAAIRTRLARLSRLAELRRADGSELIVRPHDCRRAFASEHLNNNTPVHVIQALLGHASIDTVMVYAKLYPSTLVEEYRKTVRAVYVDHHGTAALQNPTAEEWAEFQASCGMRDMGTHLCALPTGEHCARGLVCLGCGHAQPKQSAAPVFRRMLVSHRRSLTAAREGGEPAGQIAARELEVIRAAPGGRTHRRRRRRDRSRRLNTRRRLLIDEERVLTRRDRVDQIAQPVRELPEIDGGLDIHLGEIAAAEALHEHDPVALGHRYGFVRDALIADRDIQQRLVVEFTEHAQRIVALAHLELEIRPEPGGVQLAEQRRPRDRRGSQPLGGELVDRRKVREHHDRHPTPGRGGRRGGAKSLRRHRHQLLVDG
jgi:integrase